MVVKRKVTKEKPNNSQMVEVFNERIKYDKSLVLIEDKRGSTVVELRTRLDAVAHATARRK